MYVAKYKVRKETVIHPFQSIDYGVWGHQVLQGGASNGIAYHRIYSTPLAPEENQVW